MPRRIAAGSVGHAAITRCNSVPPLFSAAGGTALLRAVSVTVGPGFPRGLPRLLSPARLPVPPSSRGAHSAALRRLLRAIRRQEARHERIADLGEDPAGL